eukprot:360753-Chlamydomonas_euryale.AAC.4
MCTPSPSLPPSSWRHCSGGAVVPPFLPTARWRCQRRCRRRGSRSCRLPPRTAAATACCHQRRAAAASGTKTWGPWDRATLRMGTQSTHHARCPPPPPGPGARRRQTLSRRTSPRCVSACPRPWSSAGRCQSCCAQSCSGRKARAIQHQRDSQFWGPEKVVLGLGRGPGKRLRSPRRLRLS